MYPNGPAQDSCPDAAYTNRRFVAFGRLDLALTEITRLMQRFYADGAEAFCTAAGREIDEGQPASKQDPIAEDWQALKQ